MLARGTPPGTPRHGRARSAVLPRTTPGPAPGPQGAQSAPQTRPARPARRLPARGDPSRRLGITLLAIVFVLSLFAGRLVQLQGMESGSYRKLASQERDKTIPLPAMRGSITGANGQVLAMTVATYQVTADPTQIPAAKLQQVAGALAGPLGMTSAAVLAKLQHPTSRQYVVLAKGVPAQASSEITALDLPGIGQTASYARSYPAGQHRGQHHRLHRQPATATSPAGPAWSSSTTRCWPARRAASRCRSAPTASRSRSRAAATSRW